MNFLINDNAKSSSKQAISLEHAYDNNSVSGFMFCTYSTDTLVSVDMTDILELWDACSGLCPEESEVYKLHVTKGSVH